MIKILFLTLIAGIESLIRKMFRIKSPFEDIDISDEITNEAIATPPLPKDDTISTPPLKSDTQPRGESIEQLIERITKEYGVDAILACKVAKCESGLNPKAVNEKGNYPSTSRDRGLFQINSFWHKGVSDEQAFNPEFATRFFCQAVKDGKLRWWSSSQHCWNKDHKYYD